MLRVAGTLYLLVLAWRLVGSPVVQGHPAEHLGFAQAALFQAVNPKSWVKAITVASVFMPTQLSVTAGALLVSVIGAVVGFPCISMWALFGVGIGRFLSSPARRRVFNVIMAASLAVLAFMLF